MTELNNKKVDWKVFIWAIGIILLIFGWFALALSALNGKVEASEANNVEMKVMIAEIKNDVSWIKDKINTINGK